MTPRTHRLPPAVDGQIVSVGTARDHGVSPDRLRGNDLERRVYGVRGPLGSADDFEQRCRLFAARLDPDVFFSHSTAARLLGAPLPARLERMTRLHVTVTAPRRAPHASGLIGHSRTVAPDDVIDRGGLRVSAPTRNLCEMSNVLDLPRLVAVADFFIRRRAPLCTREDLAERLTVGDRLTRSGILRRAVELADDRAESPPESVLRVILTVAGIPPTATNFEVAARGRRYRIDLAYVGERVAIEYQGAHHFDAAVRKNDMSRRSHLEAEGWIVVELNSDDLDDPEGVVWRVRAALRRSRSG